jgi:hypothetical protein
VVVVGGLIRRGDFCLGFATCLCDRATAAVVVSSSADAAGASEGPSGASAPPASLSVVGLLTSSVDVATGYWHGIGH